MRARDRATERRENGVEGSKREAVTDYRRLAIVKGLSIRLIAFPGSYNTLCCVCVCGFFF